MKRLALATLGALLVLGLLIGPASAFAARPTYLTSYVEPESGPAGGEMEAERVAVNEETGVIYVISALNNAVNRFSASGEFLGQLTGSQITSGPHPGSFAFDGVNDAIAVDNSGGAHHGWVYVLGENNGATGLSAFDSTGAFKWQVGNTAFPEPPHVLSGLAVDPTGGLWVADQIKKGARQINPENGSSLEGEIIAHEIATAHIAFDSQGDLYAAADQDVLYKYTAPFNKETKGVQVNPNAIGTFEVATDAATGYVFQDRFGLVNTFDSAGNEIYPSFEPHEGQSLGIAVDASRQAVYITDNHHNVEVWTLAPQPQALTVNQTGTGSGSVECEVNGGGLGPCPATILAESTVKVVVNAAVDSELVSLAGTASAAGHCSVESITAGSCEFTIEEPTTITAKFTAPGLTVYLGGNGNGTVTSTSPDTAIQCGTQCSAPYLSGTVVDLQATPASGSVFAGWIGCKHLTAETCEVTINGESEVTAVFLAEGPAGVPGQNGKTPAITPFSGNQHGCPEGGYDIALESNHYYVCNGTKGTNGTNGTNGSNGAAGPQGPEGKQGPAGPASKVTCVVKKKGAKVKVTCTVKQVASASSVHWRLARHGRTYRRGLARHGRVNLGALSPGHYRLHVQGQKGSTSIVIA
ncbi:MAG TPA: hypothetical protein VFP23_00315 [Solirubrobacterales bacterium]|nr:hypothetical protein [Solirubrobacterales bacterium]